MANRRAVLGQVLAIARKELVTSLRDRQTVLYTFVLPICMYPLLFWGMLQVVLVVQGKRERTEVEIGLASAIDREVPEQLAVRLARGPEDDPEADSTGVASEVVTVITAEKSLSEEEAQAWLRAAPLEHARGAEARGLDGVLWLDQADPERAHFFYDSTTSRAKIAEDRVRNRLARYSGELRQARAQELGIDPAQLDTLELVQHDLAPAEDRAAVMIATIFPMLLVVMTLFGAFFPAIDLTAGEKERGSAETTWLLPAPRWAIHNGKILATTVLALIAVALNLLASVLSAESLLASIPKLGGFPLRFPIGAFCAVIPLAVLFAFFTSAVLVAIACLAPTYKAGQALMGPAQILFILPAIGGVLPGVELTPALALVPVLNVVLAFKALLIGAPLYLAYAMTAAALLVYAALAVLLSTRLASREDVFLAGTSLPIRRLLALLRGSGSTR
mgnify:CR=1 FL=1